MAIQMMCWRGMLAPSFIPQQLGNGHVFGATAARDDTAVIVMHTGHGDARSRRRLFFPGTPAAWVADGMLKKEGAEAFQEVARGLMLGLGAVTGASAAQWLIAYPNMFEDGLSPAVKVGFRFVNFVRVCLFTERMPEGNQINWP
jgi:hypothetical protein